MFTQARKEVTDVSDTDFIKERRLFLRYIPCEVVICLGLDEETEFSRILVATAPGKNGRAALRLGSKLASAVSGNLTALHVNPNVGVAAEEVGERRLESHITKSLGKDHPDIDSRVIVDDRIDEGIKRVWEEGLHDLVVIGVTVSQLEVSLGARLGKKAVVVMVSTASPFTSQSKQFLDEVAQLYVPQITRDDRVALVDSVQSNAAWNFDFVALMVLSTVMAAIGLIQNSGAVVIGAMLVAPLMTPLMGLGLSLVQGNRMLAKMSFHSVILGVGVSLLGGFLVGSLAFGFQEPTLEMLARGVPGFLDLMVAFAAGMAAAYASTRPNLIAALPGVAIAAALVPPIATAGLALSLGQFDLAIGALLLFGINMVTIILASMLSLWLVGFRNLKKAANWSMMGGSVIITAVLVLGLYLSFHHQKHALTEDLPDGLIAALQQQLGERYQLNNLAIAYDEMGLQLVVDVYGEEPISENMATEVRILASRHYEHPVRVRLMTLINVKNAEH
jgi:uncharacterized hydrophobic protein (TIGR00271 family)